jgi:hypothetical protein
MSEEKFKDLPAKKTADMPTGLYWKGKKTEVDRVVLPFQTIETINESRATRESEKGTFLKAFRGEPDTSWYNRLIWGDNKYIMASLLEEFAGKIDLIYIDPPFATGADFSVKMTLGDAEWTKEPSAIEDKAYRDTWGQGLDSYLQMMYERIILMRDLLCDKGTILVHIGSNINHAVRLMMDEIFGNDNYRNEIIVKRGSKNVQAQFESIDSLMCGYDTLLLYTRQREHRFKHLNTILEEARSGTWNNHWRGTDRPTMRYELYGIIPDRGQWRWSRERTLKAVRNYGIYFSEYKERMSIDEYYMWILETTGDKLDFVRLSKKSKPEHYVPPTDLKLLNDVWLDIPAYERSKYPTQKSEIFLERILEWLTIENSLVADFFCGSGTTGAVAEKLGRRWIMADLGRYAIHTTRKRLLGIDNCKPFVVQNLGKYERQYWQGVTFKKRSNEQLPIYEYIRFILELYNAEPLTGMLHIHGKKGKRFVHVGAVDAPVTLAEIKEAMDEVKQTGQKALDVLGWEWEMGLHDVVEKAAKESGIHLRLLFIPRDVMDPRAVEKGDVTFYELAYLEVEATQTKSGAFKIELKDFAIPNLDLIPQEVRDKIKKWSDYIDYWSVDWDWNAVSADLSADRQDRQEDTFHNMWQSYRTRKERKLELTSDVHRYENSGDHKIMVKVIDIFGNDTTHVVEVKL